MFIKRKAFGDIQRQKFIQSLGGDPKFFSISLLISFIYAFDLFQNGLLLIQGTDYTTSTTNYTLANNPTTTSNILVQQTFARTGAA